MISGGFLDESFKLSMVGGHVTSQYFSNFLITLLCIGIAAFSTTFFIQTIQIRVVHVNNPH